MRRDVIRRRRILVGARVDGRMQGVTGNVIYIDAPRRCSLLLHAHLQRTAHGEDHRLAIGRDIHVLHIPGVRSRDSRRDVCLRGARRGALALIEVGLGNDHLILRGDDGGAQHPHIVLVRRNRPLHIEEREVDVARIGGLAVGDVDTAAATAGAQGRSRDQDQNVSNHPSHVTSPAILSPCRSPWRGECNVIPGPDSRVLGDAESVTASKRG